MYFKKNKLPRYVATAFFTIGTVLSVGFLGVAGLYLIYPSILLAAFVFLFSGAIEETVYGKSIYKGLGRLKLIGPKALQHLLKLELDDHLANFIKEKGIEDLERRENDFLKDYFQQREYYKNLKKNQKNHSSTVDKNKLIEAKKRLKDLREFFYAKTMECKSDGLATNYIDNDLASRIQVFRKRAKRRYWFLSAFFVVCLLVGLGTAFVTASAMNLALLDLGIILSVGTLSAVIWPVAIFAMIGAVFLLYKNTTDFFKEDTKAILKELWKHIRQSPAKAGGLAFIIVLLTVFAAVATWCTWWLAVKLGLNLIPGVPLILVTICCPILVTLNFITDLTYGVSTTSKTIQALSSIRASKLVLRLKNNFETLRRKETLGQLLNPFRIISIAINIPFKLLIFAAHVVSMGITTDTLGKVPPIFVAICCAIPEALQDASFFLEGDKTSHDHDHGGVLMRLLVWTKNIVLIACLIPFFDAFWHWSFKKKGSDLTFKEAFSIAIKRCCDLGEHKHEHDTTPTDQTPPVLSEAWRETHKPEFILSKAKRRLDSVAIDSSTAKKKQQCLVSLMSEREQIVSFIKDNENEENEKVYCYLKTPKEENPTNGHLTNGLSNGCANGSANMDVSRIKAKEKSSSFDILNQPRTWIPKSVCFFKNRKKSLTTTSELVEEAFSLVAKAG